MDSVLWRKRMKESNYCLRLEGSWCFAQRSLSKLNNHRIGLEALSMGADQIGIMLQRMNQSESKLHFLFFQICLLSPSCKPVCFTVGQLVLPVWAASIQLFSALMSDRENWAYVSLCLCGYIIYFPVTKVNFLSIQYIVKHLWQGWAYWKLSPLPS